MISSTNKAKINKKLLGERLRHLMDKHNETTYSLGSKFNLSPPTISRYTRGEMVPKMTTIKVIAEYFNVNPLWLTGESSSIYAEEVLDEADETKTSIPVYCDIKYDLPLFSNKRTDKEISLPVKKIRDWGAVLALSQPDDAMSPIIEKDDVIVVKLDPELKSHRLAALHVDKGDLIIRRVTVKGKQIILQPGNLNYEAEVYNLRRTNIQMIGSVVYRQHIVEEEFSEEGESERETRAQEAKLEKEDSTAPAEFGNGPSLEGLEEGSLEENWDSYGDEEAFNLYLADELRAKQEGQD